MSADTTPTNETVDSPPLMLGRGVVLNDRYRLDRCLASGGYGDVWSAHDLRENNRIIAIKILRTDAGNNDPSALARMRLEANILSKIQHPNIVTVYGFFESPYGPYVAMEMLNGLAIDQVLQKQGPGSHERVAVAVVQLLGALQAAHDKDILHRDIKPENIILVPGPTETAKLIDFGIAKAGSMFADDESGGITLVQTRAGGFMGTPRYTAPEQVVGDPIGPSADLFALGLVISEWLTGKVRMDGEKHSDLMSQLLSPTAVPLNDVPERWKKWLAKVLEKEPTKRYQTAPEAASAFQELVIRQGKAADFIDDGLFPGGQNMPAGPSFVGTTAPLELDLDRVKAADQHAQAQRQIIATTPMPKRNDGSQPSIALQAPPAPHPRAGHAPVETHAGAVEYVFLAAIFLISYAATFLVFMWAAGGLQLP